MINGFLNIYKPKGITSHDVVFALRKSTGIKKIGHTGTLDPLAQGVLPCALGKATRLVEYIVDSIKFYRADILFGTKTDSDDIEGKIISKVTPIITKEEISKALNGFKGRITQVPPMISAIKVNGKRLYKIARKGENVDIKPPERDVEIFKIELINFTPPDHAIIEVLCSKGTYIRSIARDLGDILGCGACIYDLWRLKSGVFEISNAMSLEKISEFSSKNKLEEIIYPPEIVMDIQGIELINTEDYMRIKNGNNIILQENEIKFTNLKKDMVLLRQNNKLAALLKITQTNDGSYIASPIKVFMD